MNIYEPVVFFGGEVLQLLCEFSSDKNFNAKCVLSVKIYCFHKEKKKQQNIGMNTSKQKNICETKFEKFEKKSQKLKFNMVPHKDKDI
jgi:hypothetical protein